MILAYTLNVILFQLAFLLIYELFLKKETFFNYNRLYLLLTPTLALLLPFLKLDFLADAVPANANIYLPEFFIGKAETPVMTLPEIMITPEEKSINWWLVTYLLGLGISLILFLKKYQSLNRLFRFRKISEEKDFKIIEIPNSSIACTFFNTIFLGDQLSENERNQILSHELVHVKEKHSFDLIFFEVLRIIFWFNPLIYIYQSRIAGLHEFIADEEVLKTTEKKTYYEQLLNSAFGTQNISFINQFFNHSLIKKRIIMLQKNKSSRLSKFKFLIIIPLMLAMLTYVSCSDNQQSDAQTETIYESAEKEKTDLNENLSDMENLNKEMEKDQLSEVPFAVIDQVPLYPECEGLTDREAQKECVSSKIADHVNKNFDTGLGKELGLTGVNRIVVQFKIDEQGEITGVRSRALVDEAAARERLQAEALRVIEGLPKMKPGKHEGKEVSVLYSLPIVFKVP